MTNIKNNLKKAATKMKKAVVVGAAGLTMLGGMTSCDKESIEDVNATTVSIRDMNQFGTQLTKIINELNHEQSKYKQGQIQEIPFTVNFNFSDNVIRITNLNDLIKFAGIVSGGVISLGDGTGSPFADWRALIITVNSNVVDTQVYKDLMGDASFFDEWYGNGEDNKGIYNASVKALDKHGFRIVEVPGNQIVKSGTYIAPEFYSTGNDR
jgi:hypothetical protein